MPQAMNHVDIRQFALVPSDPSDSHAGYITPYAIDMPLRCHEPLDQLKRSEFRCLTTVSCSHGQNFQLYEYGVPVWSIRRQQTWQCICTVLRSHVGTQRTDAIVLYSTVQYRSKQNNSIQLNVLHALYAFMYPCTGFRSAGLSRYGSRKHRSRESVLTSWIPCS